MMADNIESTPLVKEFCSELRKILAGNSQAPVQRSIATEETGASKIPPRKMVKLPPHEHLLFSGLTIQSN